MTSKIVRVNEVHLRANGRCALGYVVTGDNYKAKMKAPVDRELGFRILAAVRRRPGYYLSSREVGSTEVWTWWRSGPRIKLDN